MVKYMLFLIFGVVAICRAEQKNSGDKLVVYEVYKIENRQFTDGVLSVDTQRNFEKEGNFDTREFPSIAVWDGSAGQRWRLDSKLLYSGFELRPTSYESFVLQQDEVKGFFSWVGSLTNFGKQKLWYLNNVGEGDTQIKNRSFDTCLSATGVNASIQAVTCTNTPDQRWTFTKL